MSSGMSKIIGVCLVTGFLGCFQPPGAIAQEEVAGKPLMIVKIPDIEKLLVDIQPIVPQTGELQSVQPSESIRSMFHGTGWIDKGRAIVVGMFRENSRSSLIALIPFLTENDVFRSQYNAITGEDYYLVSLPPRPDLTVYASYEKRLIEASRSPATGSLVMEAAVSKLLDAAGPMIEEYLESIETSQPAGKPQLEENSPDPRVSIQETLKLYKQVDILRFGLDSSGDIFTLRFDAEALAGTALAGVLVDPGKQTRLMHYPLDMPVQLHFRSYNMSGMVDFLQASFGTTYRQMGVDIDEMYEMTKSFTGETASGFDVTPDGISVKIIATLKPGIDGEVFLRDAYLPWLQRYGKTLADLASQESDEQQQPLYVRTEDSIVAGIRVMGVKTNLQIFRQPGTKIFENLDMEIRMAATGDMILIASDDAGIEELLNGLRDRLPAPASDNIGRLAVDPRTVFNVIQPLIFDGEFPIEWPADIEKITTRVTIQNGRIETLTNFNIHDIRELLSAFTAGYDRYYLNKTRKMIPPSGRNQDAADAP